MMQDHQGTIIKKKILQNEKDPNSSIIKQFLQNKLNTNEIRCHFKTDNKCYLVIVNKSDSLKLYPNNNSDIKKIIEKGFITE